VRAVVQALATDGQNLILDGPAKARLRDLCDPAGVLRPDAQERVERLLREHLRTPGDDAEYLDLVLKAAREAMADGLSGEGRRARKAVDEVREK